MIERPSLTYCNVSKRFSMVKENFTKQYFRIYLVRLKEVTSFLEDAIKRRWKDSYKIRKLYKLSECNHEKCIVIGTLFKNQKMKPSILKQLAESNNLIPQPVMSHFTDQSDELFIEDELQRFKVVGGLKASEIVTGVSCALLGSDDGKGKFFVEDYVFVGLHMQLERPIPSQRSMILFLSSLDLVNIAKFEINLNCLLHWVTSCKDDMNLSLLRIIVAGNSIRSVPERMKSSISMLRRKPESQDTYEAVQLLDKLLITLAQVVDVDIMPGENDPSNHILPQLPFHQCLFPHAHAYKSLHCVSNPYEFSIHDGLNILGTSGQNITDIMRYCDIEDPIEVMELCLRWGHIAPTAPDTLGCYPFYEQDPFVLKTCPHVFFAGNQSTFGTKLVNGDRSQTIRLISIPQFSDHNIGCLLDLQTLECMPVSFLAL